MVGRLLFYKNVECRKSVSLLFIPVVQWENSTLSFLQKFRASQCCFATFCALHLWLSCTISFDLMTPTEQMKDVFDTSWRCSTYLGVPESAPTHQLGWREQGRSTVVAAHAHWYPVVNPTCMCWWLRSRKLSTLKNRALSACVALLVVLWAFIVSVFTWWHRSVSCCDNPRCMRGCSLSSQQTAAGIKALA